jgi:hypothetical protein
MAEEFHCLSAAKNEGRDIGQGGGREKKKMARRRMEWLSLIITAHSSLYDLDA